MGQWILRSRAWQLSLRLHRFKQRRSRQHFVPRKSSPVVHDETLSFACNVHRGRQGDSKPAMPQLSSGESPADAGRRPARAHAADARREGWPGRIGPAMHCLPRQSERCDALEGNRERFQAMSAAAGALVDGMAGQIAA